MTDEIADTPTLSPFLRVGEIAEPLFGANTPATRARIARMADAGSIKCVRVGIRGDRLIPRSELERLMALADANLRGGGPDAPAA